MIKIIYILLIFTYLGFSQKNISLDEAIQISLENNVDLKTVKLDVRTAEMDVKEAFGYALPNISLNANYTRNVILPKFVFGGSFFPPSLIQFAQETSQQINVTNPFAGYDPNAKPSPVEAGLKNAFGTTIELNQTIFNYTVINGIGATSIYKKVQEERLNSQELKTIQSTKSAYYTALIAKESIGLVEQSLDNATKRYNDIKVMLENGLISEYDELRASVQIENLKTEKMNAETNFQNALNGLKITIGMKIEEEIILDGKLESFISNLETPEKAKIQSDIEVNNFDLKAVDKQIEVQEAFVDSEVSTFYPNLNLFANYSYQGQANDFDFITFDQSAVGLRLSWTLFQGFQRSSKLEKAKINKEKIMYQKDLLTKSLNNQAELLALRMQSAKQQIESGTKTVKQAERGFEIANIRYKEGVGSLLEINDSDLSLRQAKINKLQAIYNYLNAKSELDNLTGVK